MACPQEEVLGFPHSEDCPFWREEQEQPTTVQLRSSKWVSNRNAKDTIQREGQTVSREEVVMSKNGRRTATKNLNLQKKLQKGKVKAHTATKK